MAASPKSEEATPAVRTFLLSGHSCFEITIANVLIRVKPFFGQFEFGKVKAVKKFDRDRFGKSDVGFTEFARGRFGIFDHGTHIR
jgi:hypothetical protein